MQEFLLLVHRVYQGATSEPIVFVDVKIESGFSSPYSKVHDFFASLLTQEESDGRFYTC